LKYAITNFYDRSSTNSTARSSNGKQKCFGRNISSLNTGIEIKPGERGDSFIKKELYEKTAE